MDDINISVVVPIYNSASYVSRTLDSVLQQTELPSEIVIVDDESTDNTIEVLDEYKRKYAEIIKLSFFSQNNQGEGAARNRGVKEAQETWIAFLDSDDIWLPEKINVTKEIIRQHPDNPTLEDICNS